MPAVCLVCSDALEGETIVTIRCGHVFHHRCLQRWFNRNFDCPTCRSPTSGVIKLFLEIDDSEERSTVQDILKANEVLAEKLSSSENQTTKLRSMLVRRDTQLRTANDGLMFLKRQKNDDDMTIAGLRCSDRDATTLIDKLKKELSSFQTNLTNEQKFWQNFEKEIDQLVDGLANDETESSHIPPIDVPLNSRKRTAPADFADRLLESTTDPPPTFVRVQKLESSKALLVCSSCRSCDSNFHFCNCE